MNILFVSTAYIEPGMPSTGLPNYLRRVSYALTEKKHKVIILYSASYNQRRYDREVEVIALRIPHLFCEDEAKEVERRSIIASFILNKKTDEIINERNIDIVQFTSLDGIGRMYHSRIPAVLRLSSYHKTYFSSGLTYNQKVVDAYANAERESARGMARIYAPCAITAEAFGSDIGRKVDVIETPFENDIEKPDESFFEEHLRGLKYVLFFGSMYAEKGILVIAKILRDFLAKWEEYYFVAIGDILAIDGRNADDILYEAADECRDRVRIFEPIPHDKLYPVIRNADFVVLPSLMDNLPNACIEAMYFRRIVIGTKGASFDQLIKDGENGFLCNIGDDKSLLNKMEFIASLDKSERGRIGENARKRIDILSPENAVEQLLGYFRSVIDNKGNRIGKAEDTSKTEHEICELIEKHRTEINSAMICEADKQYLQKRILVRWIHNTNAGISCIDYFKKRGYERIVVYGVYELGQMLINELTEGGLNVLYGVDRRKRVSKVPVYNPKDILPQADVMVVTAVSAFYEIRKDMEARFTGDIVSIEDVIFV